MRLRKCPACPNLISIDTEMCPICGCNPRWIRLRRLAAWALMAGAAGWAVVHYGIG